MQLQAQYEVLREAGAELVVAAYASHEAVDSWCSSARIAYPVLADSAHQVAEAYGAYNLEGRGGVARSTFVVDTDGSIAWKSPVGLPSVEQILEHLP